MGFDERLDRLAERHEALAQSVEMLRASTRENNEQIRKNTEAIERNAEHIGKLISLSNRDAVDLRALARIAESHERRITHLEGETPS